MYLFCKIPDVCKCAEADPIIFQDGYFFSCQINALLLFFTSDLLFFLFYVHCLEIFFHTPVISSAIIHPMCFLLFSLVHSIFLWYVILSEHSFPSMCVSVCANVCKCVCMYVCVLYVCFVCMCLLYCLYPCPLYSFFSYYLFISLFSLISS